MVLRDWKNNSAAVETGHPVVLYGVCRNHLQNKQPISSTFEKPPTLLDPKSAKTQIKYLLNLGAKPGWGLYLFCSRSHVTQRIALIYGVPHTDGARQSCGQGGPRAKSDPGNFFHMDETDPLWWSFMAGNGWEKAFSTSCWSGVGRLCYIPSDTSCVSCVSVL